MEQKPDICIYHGGCDDGFGAAWAVWKRWPSVQFVPGVYGKEPPDVTGKTVLMVDFSYKRPIIEAMAKVASYPAPQTPKSPRRLRRGLSGELFYGA